MRHARVDVAAQQVLDPPHGYKRQLTNEVCADLLRYFSAFRVFLGRSDCWCLGAKGDAEYRVLDRNAFGCDAHG